MRLLIVVSLLMASGCAAPDVPVAEPVQHVVVADANMTAVPGLIGNVTEPGLMGLEMFTYHVSQNVFIPFAGPETLAMRVVSDAPFQFNGGADAPVLLLPIEQTDTLACQEATGRLLGAAGTGSDTTVSRHPAGEYLLVSFGGSGNAYFSGYPSNADGGTVEWLIVDDYVRIESHTETFQASGLQASFSFNATAVQEGQGVVVAGLEGSDTLGPGYFTKAGDGNYAVTIDDCATRSGAAAAVLPFVGTQLGVVSNNATHQVEAAFDRVYDDGTFVFGVHTITWARQD